MQCGAADEHAPLSAQLSLGNACRGHPRALPCLHADTEKLWHVPDSARCFVYDLLCSNTRFYSIRRPWVKLAYRCCTDKRTAPCGMQV